MGKHAMDCSPGMVSSGSENRIVDPPNVNIPMDLCTGPQDGVFKACETAATLPDDPRRAIYLTKESHCITPVHAPSTWRPWTEVKIAMFRGSYLLL